MTRQYRALVLAPLVVALLTAVAPAGPRPSSDRSGPREDERYRDEGLRRDDEWFRDRSRYGSVNGQFPSEEVREAVVANAQATNARAVAREAESALDRAVRQAWRNFENSKEYRDAVDAERTAYLQYETARNSALQPLGDDPRYQALMSLRNDLAARIADARDESQQPLVIQTSTRFGIRPAAPGPVRSEVLALATARLAYSSDARAMENELVSGDGRVREAQERLITAGARVAGLRAEFDDSLRTDPDLLEARRSLEQARIARVTSAAYYAGTLSAARRAIHFAYYVHRGDLYYGNGYNNYDYGCGYGYGSGVNYPYRFRY